MLEYVALGDFQTAVGFLLASPPDRSQRYYRDALCVLGMAFACGLQAAGGAAAGDGGAPGPQDAAARSLFVQAAKVITANAASVGDTLLGVPLLCSTGGLPCACTPLPLAALPVLADHAHPHLPHACPLANEAAPCKASSPAQAGPHWHCEPLTLLTLSPAGQHADAISLLQDSGLWRYASALAAHSLR